jgi:hypothetical protein
MQIEVSGDQPSRRFGRLHLRRLLGQNSAQTVASERAPQLRQGPISRRELFQTAALTPALGLRLNRPWDLRRTLTGVQVLTGGVVGWDVDAGAFSGTPRITARDEGDTASIAVRGARFPGTALSADFDARIQRVAASWRIGITFAGGHAG